MEYKFTIVDVFSRRAFGGNQLAVLPEADGLSTEMLQNIAREFNFSETAFVTRVAAKQNRFKVRIFTPTSELAFAGHPTIGTACVLVMGGYAGAGDHHRLILDEGVGPIVVDVTHRDGVLHGKMTLAGKLEQPAAIPSSLMELSNVLSLPVSDVSEAFFASLGLPFCFVQLASRDAVDRARMNREAWVKHLSGTWAPHLFLFSGDIRNESELYARMFAPALGIEEDPATGSACAALVAAAAARAKDANVSIRLHIKQGVAMGRESDIEAMAGKSDGKITSVSVGGATTFVASGHLSIPGAV